jgi:hypothetical protein
MIDSIDYADTRERIHELLVDPDLAPIHRRGRRRRLRRRATTTALSVAAIAVVAVVLAQIAAPRPAVVPATPHPIAGPLHGPAVSLSDKTTLVDEQPADQQRSYALLKAAGGQYAIARTLDGGATWQAWQLPSVFTSTSAPQISVESNGSLEVLSASARDRNGSLVSADDGRTWTAFSAPKTDGPAVETLPDGWSAEPLDGKVLGVDPATGVAHPLAHQPQTATRCMFVNQAKDGSLWMACPAKDGGFVLQVSHDRGLTWKNTAAPSLVETGGAQAGGCGQWIESYDGTTGYAYGFTKASNGNESGVLVTGDGGKTWTTTPVTLPAGVGLCPTLAANGSLLAVKSGHALISANGGRTFTDVPGLNEPTQITRFAGSDSLIAKTAHGWMTSPDGTHWTPVPVPPNVTRP